MAEIGPVEFAAIAFPGNQFKGEIAPAIADLVKSGTIRIIDLAFVSKDADGNTLTMELEDMGGDVGAAFQEMQAVVGDLLNEADLKEAAAGLEPNNSALLLVWEDVWAARLAQALRNAGGVLLSREIVPYEAVNAAVEWAQGKQE
jgi:uncharacterized membrane protein